QMRGLDNTTFHSNIPVAADITVGVVYSLFVSCQCFRVYFLFVTMDSPSFLLICREQGNRSIEAHIAEYLDLAHQLSFLDNCLCSFLFVGLNASTKAQLSEEGPRGSFAAYVEWVLASCGSSFTVGFDDNDTSPTPTPVPSQEPPDGEERQRDPTRDREPASTAMQEPATNGKTEQNIA
ncbi:hypothetical protein DPX16_8207, partial [Anabarilius grahami]